MAVRLDVRSLIHDPRGNVAKREFEPLLLKKKLRSVAVVDSYLVDAPLSKKELAVAGALLANPRTEEVIVGRYVPKVFNFALEVAYLPGVTDNAGATAKETIEDGLKRKFKAGQGVYSARVFYLTGLLSRTDAEAIAAGVHNPLIQRASVMSAAALRASRKKPPVVPRVKLEGSSRVTEVDLEISDEELEKLGKLGIKDKHGRRGPLALSLQYLKTIREHFRKLKRKPTDVELESLAQTWSEHCKHTIFANPLDDISDGIYRTYIKGATEKIRKEKKEKGEEDICVSVFKDNSGAIVFDDEYAVTHKVETHNSPSALDPFGGAITGIGGVNRDALGFGLGAKPVANVYGFCFAPPEDTTRLWRSEGRRNELLSAKRIAEGVIKGINTGGNQSGIPTPLGFMLFDSSYRGKPLVFAGTVGLIPLKRGGRKLYEKKARPGDYIVMVGGRVGLDGIHGATLASALIDAESPATAVQIGDPITQKKMSDAIAKEARDMNLFNSLTDCGAGGISGAIGEMARESGGARVDLEKVPLKYPGLTSWQVWLSESQERMVLAVPKGKWKQFADLMNRRGVEATAIGEFTKSGKCIVWNRGKKVMDLSLAFLHDGLPKREQYSHAFAHYHGPAVHQAPADLSKTFLALLGSHNLSGNEFLSRQFDHEVQGGSVLKPLQGAGRVSAGSAVFRPVLSSPRAVVLSYGLAPHYAPLDPYRMAASALDTAVRGAVAAGAPLSHLALLDNFCWPSGSDPERLWQLKEAARACYDYATLYGTPFISGKDSMFNDFKGYDENGAPIKISVLPTLLISALGVMKDARKAVSLDAKVAGDLVYILGETHDELGGSEYLRMLGITSGEAPAVDGIKNLAMYRALEKAISAGLVASAVSVERGGLAYALARTTMGGGLGITADLGKAPGSASASDTVLFSESQGRVIAAISPKDKAAFEKLFADVPVAHIGTVGGSTLAIKYVKKTLAKVKVSDMFRTYRQRFKDW
jgi:phosphoribosylformylglycinamidine synthase